MIVRQRPDLQEWCNCEAAGESFYPIHLFLQLTFILEKGISVPTAGCFFLIFTEIFVPFSTPLENFFFPTFIKTSSTLKWLIYLEETVSFLRNFSFNSAYPEPSTQPGTYDEWKNTEWRGWTVEQTLSRKTGSQAPHPVLLWPGIFSVTHITSQARVNSL